VSTAYAFAAVTAVLRSRLTSYLAAAGVSAGIGGVTVTALPPDRVATGPQERNGLNLFLHRATRNQAWANAGPPPRSSAGDAVAALPFGADLHYVVSAYGQDVFAHDILLGHAVALLHEEPVLTRAAIRRALAPNPPDPSIPAAVTQARLADQVERLRLTLASPSSEELSRLWSSFSAPYRASIFIEASVVLVDPTRPVRMPLPVAAIGPAAAPLEQPEIELVAAEGPPGTPVTAGTTLIVTGRRLAGPGVRVRLGESEATPATARETELRVPLAAFVPPVRARLAGLVVTQEVALGDPPVLRPAVASDAVPVAVLPTPTLAAGAVTVTTTGTVGGVPVASGNITLGVAPAVTAGQQVVLALAEVGAPPERPARGALLPAPSQNGVASGATETATIAFPFTRLPRGDYLLRLRVDGLESRVTRDASGLYNAPKVTL
jgi:hypothetical protein